MCFLGPKITPSSNFLELERIIYNIVTHKVPRGMFVLPALSQTRLPCLSRAGEVLSHILPWPRVPALAAFGAVPQKK